LLVSEPRSVIGKGVKQKFQREDTQEIQWYFIRIVDYDSTTKFFEIAYNEEETCHFDIVLDLILGDIVVID